MTIRRAAGQFEALAAMVQMRMLARSRRHVEQAHD
jgi:hypothetical protein